MAFIFKQKEAKRYFVPLFMLLVYFKFTQANAFDLIASEAL